MTVKTRMGRTTPRYIFTALDPGIFIPLPVLASFKYSFQPQPFLQTQKRMIAMEPRGRRRLDTRKSQLSRTPLFPNMVTPFKRLFSKAHGRERRSIDIKLITTLFFLDHL